MTDHRVEPFVDAILADRPPKRFSATPDDADVLRLAIELHVSRSEKMGRPPVRPGARRPTGGRRPRGRPHPPPSHREAGGCERAPLVPGLQPSPGRTRRRVGAIGTAAAALVLVAGTFAAAHLVPPSSRAPGALQGPTAAATERSGTLLTSAGVPVGHAYAYSGDPSWVMMDVVAPGFTGVYHCQLQLADGAIVTAGNVAVHNGTGQWRGPSGPRGPTAPSGARNLHRCPRGHGNFLLTAAQLWPTLSGVGSQAGGVSSVLVRLGLVVAGRRPGRPPGRPRPPRR